MKVSIGYKLENGPWGGGNRFVLEITKALEINGHVVVNDLNHSDIDLILIIDPRFRSHPNITFGAGKILNYLFFKNSEVLIVHRINECDERKNTRHVNFLLRMTNYLADHTVFIASWLIKLNVWRRESKNTVILNGASSDLFFPSIKNWNKEQPLSLVTHHWGANKMKGFDVYKHLDNLLDDPIWSKIFKFTYIGNLPKNFSFKNATHVSAKNGKELADCLREHDVYITASMNEPAGMHHVEGACCGLPLLYRNSGSLPEYCAGFGVEFDDVNDIEEKLNLIRSKYHFFRQKISEYPNLSSNRMPEWVELFERLYSEKKAISSNRRIWRNPLVLFLNKFI